MALRQSDLLYGFDSFENTGLKEELKKALKEMGFENPTEVQAQAIPLALEGKDLIVRSKTGSGKTGAFVIPILEMLEHKANAKGIEALVITPTRELALQIADVFSRASKYTGIKSVVVYGGVSINPQADKIRSGARIVIGTPGRIIDLMERGVLDLSSIRFLVLDEADIMLEMGFIDDVKYIIENMPEKKQMMLFSATMPRKIKEVAYEYMHDIANIEVGGEEEIAVKSIQNLYAAVNKSSKFSALLAFLDEHKPRKAIVFVEQKRSVYFVSDLLRKFGYSPISLHGGMTQKQREFSIEEFKAEEAGLLIATNVAARGLDIPNITDIINFDAPDDPKVYIHRVGRSARMGKDGRAFTIFTNGQRGLLNDIERMSGKEFNEISLDLSKFSNAEGNNFERDLNPLSYENNHGRQRFYHPSNRRLEGSSGRFNRFQSKYKRTKSRRGRHGNPRDLEY